jgi:C-terminal processing protease CtpA/Prc
MKTKRLYPTLATLLPALLVLLTLILARAAQPVSAQTATPPPTAAPKSTQAAPALPPAKLVKDEGGPAVVTGEWNYKAANVGDHYKQPVAALMDVSDAIQGKHSEWTPRAAQVLGMLTRPLAPAPTAYRINVPLAIPGGYADLDNDGQKDAGVQIYAAVLATNLVGDSYLEQMEQQGETSYLLDPQTGAVRQGTFLVYAPDAAQGFASGAGADGIFFTADDPAVALPAGYTLVTLTEDGKVSFDRSRTAQMDILNPAESVSPNFSDQGILESYNSLIDMLKERYSYTALRMLDWEQIRQKYLPAVQAADTAKDFGAYYATMRELALSIRDAHVYTYTTDQALSQASTRRFNEAYGAHLGAALKELSDGRFVVVSVDPEGPAAQAGWKFGTEVVSVDGTPIGERVKTMPLLESAGNPEVIRAMQTRFALAFAPGAKATVEYRQPGESKLQRATLTPAAELGLPPAAPEPEGPDGEMSFKQLDGGAYYAHWRMFDNPLYKIALWEQMLSQAQGAPGIILDLRQNGGGSVGLLYTMASYLFPPDKPAALHWVDNYTYDDKAGDLVKQFATDVPISSPKPELTYNGAVVVLVGEGSASAAEYLPQFLQRAGRAVVVGETGTEGAGGFLERAAMPGGFTFAFTKGRSYFAGTDELNLEAKGVDLDVRVPITLENEKAKQEGRDPVLEAGLAALDEEAAKRAAANLTGKPWQLILVMSPTGGKTPVKDPTAYTVTFGEDGKMDIQADCNKAQADYALGGGQALTIKPGRATLAACPAGSMGEDFVKWLAAAAMVVTDGNQLLVTSDPASGALGLVFEKAK